VITTFLLSLFGAVISFFNGLLPSWTLPSWLTTEGFSAVATTVGDFLAGPRGIFPVDATLTVLQEVLLLLPVILGYMIFQWVWNHVPTIAGFGTH
jgi:uncharacterized sodium:solute symporter family permease YidK